MKCTRITRFLSTIAIALIAAVCASTASATNDQHPQQQVQTQQSSANSASVSSAKSQSKSASSSKSAAQSGALSHSTSSSQGGQSSSVSKGGSSTASQGQTAQGGQSTLSNSGNSQNSNSNVATGGNGGAGGTAHATSTGTVVDASNVSTTVEGDTYEAARIPVATALAGGTNTTAGCHYSVGAGGQGSALGLSFGIGRKDKDCERFALAQFFYDRGQDVAGDRLMCAIRPVYEALGKGEECLTMVREIRVTRPDPRILKREEFNRTQGFSK